MMNHDSIESFLRKVVPKDSRDSGPAENRAYQNSGKTPLLARFVKSETKVLSF